MNLVADQNLAMYQNLRCKVDSLLGSGGERSGRKKAMGTEEKCLHEYNLTLTFEETMGRWVLYYNFFYLTNNVVFS